MLKSQMVRAEIGVSQSWRRPEGHLTHLGGQGRLSGGGDIETQKPYGVSCEEAVRRRSGAPKSGKSMGKCLEVRGSLECSRPAPSNRNIKKTPNVSQNVIKKFLAATLKRNS